MLTDKEIALLKPYERDAYLSMEPDEQLTYGIRWRKNQKSRKPVTGIDLDARSRMRVFGKYGFIVFFVISVIAWAITLDSYRPEFLWPVFWSSLASLCWTLWIFGTIELRLIEIREEMKNR